MTTSAPPASESPQHHGRLLAVIWVVSSVIAVPLVIWVLGPHLPPGDFSNEASEQTSANIVLTAVCAPIVLGVAIYFLYAVFAFRQRGSGDRLEDGAPIKGHAKTQTAWIVLTSVLVLALAIWGSLVLVVSASGAGGGQGPSPVHAPSGEKLQVQVIGQQWNWTYRFPDKAGATIALETDQLMLPADTLVQFNVTSLDVTHSFWAYELGVKADAVPGANNIAFVHTRGTGSFSIRCAELCGLWHGHMFQTGHVVAKAAFAAWLVQQAKAEHLNLKYLPPYATHYFPEPQRRAG